MAENGIAGQKATEFAMKFFEGFRIYEENGKVTMSGTFPKVPDGNEWQLRVVFMDKDYCYIGESSKDAYPSWVDKNGMRAETLMNNSGSFKETFDFGKDKVEFISVDLFLNNADTKTAATGFGITRRYSENINDIEWNEYVGNGKRYKLTEFDVISNVFGW